MRRIRPRPIWGIATGLASPGGACSRARRVREPADLRREQDRRSRPQWLQPLRLHAARGDHRGQQPRRSRHRRPTLAQDLHAGDPGRRRGAGCHRGPRCHRAGEHPHIPEAEGDRRRCRPRPRLRRQGAHHDQQPSDPQREHAGQRDDDGGGILASAKLSVKRSALQSNEADGNGGGISATTSATLRIARSTIAGNVAQGIYQGGDGGVSLSHSTVTHNSFQGIEDVGEGESPSRAAG